MKKQKILAIILALCLILPLFPTMMITAAAGDELTVIDSSSGSTLFKYDEGDDLSDVETEINALLWGTDGTDGEDVTVGGEWYDADDCLYLTVPAGRTLTWNATLISTTNFDEDDLIDLYGSGNFIVGSGATLSVIGGIGVDTIHNHGATITVHGAVLNAAPAYWNNAAIYGYGDVILEPSGIISATGLRCYAIYPGITFTNNGGDIYEFVDYWMDDGIRAEGYSQTSSDPDTRIISNAKEFGLFAYEIYEEGVDYSGWTVELAGEIDLSDHIWYPINLSDTVFDGMGNTISGLLVYDDYYDYYDDYSVAGLFGVLDRSIVRNLTLDDPVVDIYYGNWWISIGTIAGMTYGAQIRDVVVNNPTVTLNYSDSTSFLGGVVGYAMPSSDEVNSVGLYMSVINGADVYGGEISIKYGFSWEYYYDSGSVAYLGGIAGANYDSIIGSSAVYGTKIDVDSDEDIKILELDVGGIVGYTSMTDPATYGSCVLNNLSMAKINISSDVDAEYKYIGGLCGYVLNDFVVNNLYIGSLDDLFGWVDNEDGNPEDDGFDGYDEYMTAHNHVVFANVNDAWEYGDGGGEVYDMLNDVAVTPEGGMLAAAKVTNAHTAYGLETSLCRYRVWRTDGNSPYLAEWNTLLTNANLSITAPATGATAQTSASGDGYSATIEWSPALLTGGKFDSNETYTAEITLTAVLGKILPGTFTPKVNGEDVDNLEFDENNPYKVATFDFEFEPIIELPGTKYVEILNGNPDDEEFTFQAELCVVYLEVYSNAESYWDWWREYEYDDEEPYPEFIYETTVTFADMEAGNIYDKPIPFDFTEFINTDFFNDNAGCTFYFEITEINGDTPGWIYNIGEDKYILKLYRAYVGDDEFDTPTYEWQLDIVEYDDWEELKEETEGRSGIEWAEGQDIEFTNVYNKKDTPPNTVTYPVIYHGNGNNSGTVPAMVWYTQGALVTVEGKGDLAKTDYTFVRWDMDSPGSGKPYNPGNMFNMPAKEVHLYAIWEPIPPTTTTETTTTEEVTTLTTTEETTEPTTETTTTEEISEPTGGTTEFTTEELTTEPLTEPAIEEPTEPTTGEDYGDADDSGFGLGNMLTGDEEIPASEEPTKDNPKTGDFALPGLLLAMLSVVSIGGVIVSKKKRNTL